MLRPSVNHYALWREDTSEDEQFKMLADAGFHCVDFNFDVYLPSNLISNCELNDFYFQDTKKLKEFFKPYKDAAEKYGVDIIQSHAPYQLYVDGRDDVNEKCYEVVIKCLELCRYLNCKYLVVHPLNLSFAHGREYERKGNFEYYERFIPYIMKYGVMICLENMFGTVTRHVTEAVCSDFTEAANYIDVLNEKAGEECFGFCFDLGHATLLGKNIRESIKTLGQRTKILHLHDNDGIQDSHAIPYSYARNWGQHCVTDWNGLFDGLADIGYQGDLNFEVGSGLTLIPRELKSAALRYLCATGEYFAKMIRER